MSHLPEVGATTESESVDFSKYLSQLQNATLFELYRIQSAIDKMLDDPERIRQVKRQIREGETVTYFSPEKNRCVKATVLKINRTCAIVFDQEDKKNWRIPFHMINVDGVSVAIQEPRANGMGRNELSIGETVGFYDRNQQEVYGTIEKLNPKTAKIRSSDGQLWRVSYSFLFPVLNSETIANSDPHVIDAESFSPAKLPKPK